MPPLETKRVAKTDRPHVRAGPQSAPPPHLVALIAIGTNTWARSAGILAGPRTLTPNRPRFANEIETRKMPSRADNPERNQEQGTARRAPRNHRETRDRLCVHCRPSL